MKPTAQWLADLVAAANKIEPQGLALLVLLIVFAVILLVLIKS